MTMKKLLSAALLAAFACALLGGLAGAGEDKDPKAVLEKAVKALGGEENLAKMKAATWKVKGKVNFGGNSNDFTAESTAQGIDHFRSKFSGEFMGNKVEVVTATAGDKAWRTFRGDAMELAADSLANEKRRFYLQVV